MTDFKISIDTKLKIDGIDSQIQDIKSKLENALKNINAEVNIKTNADSSPIKKINDASKEAEGQVRKLGEAASSTGESWGQLVESTNRAIDVFKVFGQQILEVDNALTEFKKVSDLSGESLNKYVDQLQELGGTVGRTG